MADRVTGFFVAEHTTPKKVCPIFTLSFPYCNPNSKPYTLVFHVTTEATQDSLFSANLTQGIYLISAFLFTSKLCPAMQIVQRNAFSQVPDP